MGLEQGEWGLSGGESESEEAGRSWTTGGSGFTLLV